MHESGIGTHPWIATFGEVRQKNLLHTSRPSKQRRRRSYSSVNIRRQLDLEYGELEVTRGQRHILGHVVPK